MKNLAKLVYLVLILVLGGCSAGGTTPAVPSSTPQAQNLAAPVAAATLPPVPTATPTEKVETPTATPSHPSPFCLSQSMNWLEHQHTVTCYSYWGPEVREAVAKDLNTRINAAYLDLESGDTSENSADIYYQLSCGSMCFPRWVGMEGVIIEPLNVAPPNAPPTLEECVEILLKVKTEVSPSKSFHGGYGYYFCIQTRESRIGWIRYDKDFYSGLGHGRSQITYWVWDEFIPNP